MSGGVLPLPTPAKQTQRAEAGGEEREGGGERSGANDISCRIIINVSDNKRNAYR